MLNPGYQIIINRTKWLSSYKSAKISNSSLFTNNKESWFKD